MRYRELSDYISELQQVPDRMIVSKRGREPLLTKQLQVYDNWPILFGTDIKMVTSHLLNNGFEMEKEDGMTYDDAKRRVRLIPSLNETLTSSYGLFKDEKLIEHERVQLEQFQSAIILYGSLNYKPLEQIIRDVALATMRIGEWAMSKGIKLCLPAAYNHEQKEYDKIVYFFPKGSA